MLPGGLSLVRCWPTVLFRVPFAWSALFHCAVAQDTMTMLVERFFDGLVGAASIE